MALFETAIQYGIRADQPSAASVGAGVLYCVSDEGGTIERSNGSTWDAVGGGSVGYQTVTVQLSDAQIKTLRATEVEFIDPPGVGKAIWVVSAEAVLDQRNGVYDITDAELDFGSTGAWVNIWDSWFDGPASTDLFARFMPFKNALFPAQYAGTTGAYDMALLDNLPMCFGNVGAAEITGGGAGNTLSARVVYQIVNTVPFP